MKIEEYDLAQFAAHFNVGYLQVNDDIKLYRKYLVELFITENIALWRKCPKALCSPYIPWYRRFNLSAKLHIIYSNEKFHIYKTNLDLVCIVDKVRGQELIKEIVDWDHEHGRLLYYVKR
jgi:hypothetical protein